MEPPPPIALNANPTGKPKKMAVRNSMNSRSRLFWFHFPQQSLCLPPSDVCLGVFLKSVKAQRTTKRNHPVTVFDVRKSAPIFDVLFAHSASLGAAFLPANRIFDAHGFSLLFFPKGHRARRTVISVRRAD